MYKVHIFANSTKLSAKRFPTLDDAKRYMTYIRNEGYKTRLEWDHPKPKRKGYALLTLALWLIVAGMILGMVNWDKIISRAMYYNEVFEQQFK